MKSVIRSLNNECIQKQFSTEEEWNKQEMPSSGTYFIRNNFTKLVDQLRAQNKLPALVFRYEHDFCLHAVIKIAGARDDENKRKRREGEDRNIV